MIKIQSNVFNFVFFIKIFLFSPKPLVSMLSASSFASLKIELKTVRKKQLNF